jgi:hypothetical protein
MSILKYSCAIRSRGPRRTALGRARVSPAALVECVVRRLAV